MDWEAAIRQQGFTEWCVVDGLTGGVLVRGLTEQQAWLMVARQTLEIPRYPPPTPSHPPEEQAQKP
jgi:hypothetical protein